MNEPVDVNWLPKAYSCYMVLLRVESRLCDPRSSMLTNLTKKKSLLPRRLQLLESTLASQLTWQEFNRYAGEIRAQRPVSAGFKSSLDHPVTLGRLLHMS